MELKPCPFCGGKARLVSVSERYTVGCTIMRCRGNWLTARDYYTKDEAAEAWNTRVEWTCERSRYAELFGTHEKAARTLYYDKEPTCAGCALMGECEKIPDEEHDTCFLIDYDVLLEWLRGDAE